LLLPLLLLVWLYPESLACSSKSPPASQDDQKAVLRTSNFVFWLPLTDAGRHKISALLVLGVMIIMLKIEMMVRIALAIF
jgi:hypothetical protein